VRWLLTVPEGLDRQALAQAMTDVGGSLEDSPPIPLDEGEVVFFADGPPDLPTRLDEHTVTVHKVSPDSEPEPYGGGPDATDT
jgi:hypothetical protein